MLLSLTLAACAAPAGERAPGVDAGECTKDVLGTLYPGILTFAADQPVYPPWYMGDNPQSGEGFEAALAYAVAARLRYAAEEVRWIRVPFIAALAPGAKPFDASLSQFSITAQRKAAVDFSTPYFDVTQAVMTVRSSPAAAVRDLEGLRTVRLGAQIGSTSYTAAASLRGDAGLQAYETTVDAKMALVDGRIDAVVADLPTAFTLSNELREGVMIGQFPQSGDGAEQLGIVLNHDSPLTRCVSWAVDSLREDGTLSRLERRWLAGAGNAPVLTWHGR
ncbi:MAG: ABC transporter substrate-binding protein [Actinomycetota bacterium]|nr:ABC transporter substrate-binding protein [Actinomycetota bacterium]